MKKRFAVFGLLACAIVVVTVYGQDNGDTAKTTPASQPASPSIGLKDAYAGKFLIGCCAEARGYSEAELAQHQGQLQCHHARKLHEATADASLGGHI